MFMKKKNFYGELMFFGKWKYLWRHTSCSKGRVMSLQIYGIMKSYELTNLWKNEKL